jgi:hypothetical protein
LVLEHIAFKVWPLVNEWEIPKGIEDGSSQSDRKGGLVYLKYTYRYRNKFGEPVDEWLEAIEATCDEMLGAYTKGEDKDMNTTLGARGKRRLSKVSNVIGFIYPDYCFPARRKGQISFKCSEAEKSEDSRKSVEIVLYRKGGSNTYTLGYRDGREKGYVSEGCLFSYFDGNKPWFLL